MNEKKSIPRVQQQEKATYAKKGKKELVNKANASSLMTFARALTKIS